MGVTLRELRRLDEAEASFRQAIELDFHYAEAHSNLGITLQELGMLVEAEASLKQAIELNPDFAEAHLNLATTKKFSSHDEQIRSMEALYRDAGISDYDRCLLCFALAKAFDDLQDLLPLLSFTGKVMPSAKNSWDTLKYKTRIYFKRSSRAIRAFEPTLLTQRVSHLGRLLFL